MTLLAGPVELPELEIWTFDNNQWRLTPGRAQSGAAPHARELFAAAFDTRRKRVIIHGGIGGEENRYGDTWEWDGAAWLERNDSRVGKRDHHAMAYDSDRGKTVLFGGVLPNDTLAHSTWEWDGAKWEEDVAKSPGGRVHFAMVYDSVRKQVVLFGGIDDHYRVHNDTWGWDGKTWVQLSDGGPPKRSHHRMAFDSRTGAIVLFGGLKSGRPAEALGDTWIWDGQSWTEAKVAGPPNRSGHVMEYDPHRKGVMLYGGASFDGRDTKRYHDIWIWDGKSWKKVETQQSSRNG